MKTKISLGKTAAGAEVSMDLRTLLKTRLLLQANSGGGKSWLIRRLAEQLFGHVPIIIIDPEGEFSTLREKFDYLLVGKEGETPADLRSASMLAHKILELRASAVCDLYELKPQVRHEWVKLFLEALIDAPKKLWGPTIIIVDEAHVYCPEGKSGESQASGAMVDLATRGRKRGYGCIFATQRLGKLRKDAAAELLNVMIGMTFIDIDRERAAECLGVSREEKKKFNDEIKLLPEGDFFCLGRAISKERILIKSGGVQTSHPQAGSVKLAASPSPAPHAIKALLPQLADLPKQAEEKAKTEAELRSEIRSLKAQVAAAQKAKPTQVLTQVKEIQTLNGSDRKRLTKLIGSVGKLYEIEIALEKRIKEACKAGELMSEIQIIKTKLMPLYEVTVSEPKLRSFPIVIHEKPAPEYAKPLIRIHAESNGQLPFGERKILTATAQYPDGATREQLSILTGFKRSTRDAYIARLKEKNLIGQQGETILATQEGVDALGPSFEPLPTGDALIQHWRNRLPKGELAIFEVCVAKYPQTVSRQELEQLTGFKRSTRDAYIARSIARKVIEASGAGEIRVAKAFFE